MFIPIAAARERYAICKSCDEFNNILKTCKKCGCFMPAKSTVAYASCPIGKWAPSTTEPTEPNSYQIED